MSPRIATRKPAARPTPLRPKGTTQLSMNLPDDLVARLTAWVDALNENPEGARWTKTDVIRTLLVRALDNKASKGGKP